MENSITTLNTVKFSNLFNWSVPYLVESDFAFNEDYELVSLGSFLTRNKTVVNIKDDEQYTRVTVSSQNRGIKVRDVLEGKLIGTKKQYRIEANQFLMSKIDARNGAFGIVPKELDGAIVTNDFPSFIVDEKLINIEFLVLITTTKKFIEFAQSCSSGTTGRRRIDMTMFLAQKIPLPSLKEQKRIVANYKSKYLLAEEQKSKASDLEQNIELYLGEKLGIEKLEKQKTKGFRTISFKNLNIWSPWNVNSALKSTLFPSVQLGNILKLKSGKFLPKKSQEPGEYIVYGGNGFNGYHNEFIHTGPRIIIGRVGEYCGNVHLINGKYWVTDNSFYTELVNEEFDLNFLALVLKYLDLNRFRVISAQPSISQKNIINVPVPFPSKQIQKEIVNEVLHIRREITDLRKKSEKNNDAAIAEFEQEIFSN